MNPIVESLEQNLLTPFSELAVRLCAEYPNVGANVYSHSVGSLTEYQGHQVVIDCLLVDAPDNQPDNVALGVDLQHLTTTPMIDADVCWGHPSGYIEAEFLPEPMEVSDQLLTNLYSELPRLYGRSVCCRETWKAT